MPDGDRIHGKLAMVYQKVYKQICEGQFEDSILGRNAAMAARKDIQRYGNEPIKLIEEVATQLDRVVVELLFGNEVNWDKENSLIERIARSYYADKKALAIAVEACKEQLYEIRLGENPPEIRLEIMKKYMWKIYEANFEARVPVRKHYKNVSSGVIHSRLQSMRPFVTMYLLAFAEQAVRRHNVDILRRPPRASKSRDEIDLDVDLLMPGKRGA